VASCSKSSGHGKGLVVRGVGESRFKLGVLMEYAGNEHLVPSVMPFMMGASEKMKKKNSRIMAYC